MFLHSCGAAPAICSKDSPALLGAAQVHVCRAGGASAAGGNHRREEGIATEGRQKEGRRVHEGSLEKTTQKASRGEFPAVIPLRAMTQGNVAWRSV